MPEAALGHMARGVVRGGDSGEDRGVKGTEGRMEEEMGLRGGPRRKQSCGTEGRNLHCGDSSYAGLFQVWDLGYGLICVCRNQVQMLPPYGSAVWLLSGLAWPDWGCVAPSLPHLSLHGQGEALSVSSLEMS